MRNRQNQAQVKKTLLLSAIQLATIPAATAVTPFPNVASENVRGSQSDGKPEDVGPNRWVSGLVGGWVGGWWVGLWSE